MGALVQGEERSAGRRKRLAVGKASATARTLCQGEQRALASFIAGRLPAGQLHGELCRARELALAKAAAQP
nr:hypothetical protein [Thermoleophilaceae bacterium]